MTIMNGSESKFKRFLNTEGHLRGETVAVQAALLAQAGNPAQG